MTNPESSNKNPLREAQRPEERQRAAQRGGQHESQHARVPRRLTRLGVQLRRPRLGLTVLGLVVAGVFLIADPFGMHPVDQWVGHLLGLHVGHEALAGEKGKAQLWTCPMHPQILMKEPGNCPICGMDLVPVKGTGEGADQEAEHASTRGTEQGSGHSAPAAQETGLWTCPDHPAVVENGPGHCPLCDKELVPEKAASTGEGDGAMTGGVATMTGMGEGSQEMSGKAGTSAQGKTGGKSVKQLWTCGMHPQVVQDHPGTCPICQMDLTPLKMDAHEDMDAGHEASPHAGSEGPAVTIDPAVIQNMNVTTERVERRDVRRQVRTVGYLDYDPEKVVSVTTKYNGFIEKTYVNYIGQPVRRGDPLFDVYSPELVQTQQEFLSAKKYAAQMEKAPPETRDRAQSLLQAARERLGYWDISGPQIDRLEQSGQALRTLTVTAPASGVIKKRMEGLEGMAVKPGMEVVQIADLSDLWLSVEIFEGQLPWIDTGSSAEIRLSYFPGEVFTGRVRYIEPQVTDRTRSVRVSLEVPNGSGRLRAGMYATVLFHPVVAPGVVAVPSQAVIRTGERNVVVVGLGRGRFAPREVELGPEGEGFVTVLSGLDAGDEVVTSSQFLIDSESNIRAAIQKMIASASEPSANNAGHGH